MTKILHSFPGYDLYAPTGEPYQPGAEFGIAYQSRNHGILYDFFTLGSVRSYTEQYNGDVAEATQRATDQGDPLFWATRNGTSITSHKPAVKPSYPVHQWEDVIQFEGKHFRITRDGNLGHAKLVEATLEERRAAAAKAYVEKVGYDPFEVGDDLTVELERIEQTLRELAVTAKADEPEKPEEVYRGVSIFKDDSGYYGRLHAQDFGYTDTVEEIRAEIDHEWAEDQADVPDDTPSLDDTAHRIEMHVSEPEDLHDIFDEQVKLAETYCDDGALMSGARVLRALAEKLEANAIIRAARLAELAEGDAA